MTLWAGSAMGLAVLVFSLSLLAVDGLVAIPRNLAQTHLSANPAHVETDMMICTTGNSM